MKNKKIEYVEPAEYFPKSLRKEYGLGEYYSLDKKESNNNFTNDKEKNNENNHS